MSPEKAAQAVLGKLYDSRSACNLVPSASITREMAFLQRFDSANGNGMKKINACRLIKMNRFILEKIEGPPGVRIPKEAVGGEFTSASPQGASKKAFSRIYRMMGRPDKNFALTICIRKTNTTTLRKYRVRRIENKRTIMFGGKPIEIEYMVESIYLGIHEAKPSSPKKKAASSKKTPSPKKKGPSSKKPSPKKKGPSAKRK
jgi:hypothetical protein